MQVLETFSNSVETTGHLLDPVAANKTLGEESVEVTLVAIEPLLHEVRVGSDALLVEHGLSIGEGAAEGGVSEGVNDVDFALAERNGFSIWLEEYDNISTFGAERLDTELLGAVLGDAVESLALSYRAERVRRYVVRSWYKSEGCLHSNEVGHLLGWDTWMRSFEVWSRLGSRRRLRHRFP